MYEGDDTAIFEASRRSITDTLDMTKLLEEGKMSPGDYVKARALLVGKPNFVQFFLFPLSGARSSSGKPLSARAHRVLSFILIAVSFSFIANLVLRSLRPHTSLLGASILWLMASVLGAEFLMLIIGLWRREGGPRG
jgi:hypothetical protein